MPTSADLTLILVTGLAVTTGAAVQGGVGLGLALVAGPVLTLLDPTLMPGSLIVTSVTLPVLTLARELGHVDWHGFRWAFAGRVIGTAGGVWLVARLSQQALGVAVGVMVLVTAALTLHTVQIRRTRSTLAVAGLVGGVSGTATAIGGPPVALVYQHAPGPIVRATLAAFFLFGGLLSLTSLAVAGELGARQLGVGVTLIPFVLTGFLLSAPLRNHLDQGRTRTAVLAVASLSAAVVIVRSLG
jgi:uncharacterized protein